MYKIPSTWTTMNKMNKIQNKQFYRETLEEKISYSESE